VKQEVVKLKKSAAGSPSLSLKHTTIKIRNYMGKQEKVQEVKRTFQYIKEDSQQLVKETESLDRELSQKIREVERTSEEVVKHIQKRQDG
jgi:hypothetical protein